MTGDRMPGGVPGPDGSWNGADRGAGDPFGGGMDERYAREVEERYARGLEERQASRDRSQPRWGRAWPSGSTIEAERREEQARRASEDALRDFVESEALPEEAEGSQDVVPEPGDRLEHPAAVAAGSSPPVTPAPAAGADAPSATRPAPANPEAPQTVVPAPAVRPERLRPREPVVRSVDARLARLHLRGGLVALARAELETMAGLGTLDLEALSDLAEARWRSGDLLGAGEAAQAHLERGGDELMALVVAVEALTAQGRTVDARRLAAQVVHRGRDLDGLFAGQPRAHVWPRDGEAVLPPPPPVAPRQITAEGTEAEARGAALEPPPRVETRRAAADEQPVAMPAPEAAATEPRTEAQPSATAEPRILDEQLPVDASVPELMQRPERGLDVPEREAPAVGPALRVGPEPLFSDEMFSTEEAERAEAEAERAAMEVEWPEAPAPRDEGEAVTVDGPSATPDETQLLETSQLEVPAEPFGGEAQEPAAEGFEQEAPQEWATPEPWPQETLDATSPMRGRPESGGLEGERAEAEHREAERLEAERAEAEHSEAERAEAERLERERAEAERAEAERAEAERAEADRLEAERLEAARAEAEREGGPRRRVRPPTGAAELEGIELALREGEVESVAGRLALLLRTEPTLAPRIVELASWAVRLTGGSGVDAANLHLVRGDGYRLLGRDSEAEAAYEASRRALEPRWPAGSAW